MTIELRNIAIDDTGSIRELSAQLGYELSITDTEERIKEIASLNDHAAFVALDGERIIGWIHGYRSVLLECNPFMEIGGLVVDENYRGKGVGKKLVQRVKEWCLEKGVSDLRVRSNVKRSTAHQFYLTQGFVEEKQQKVFQIDL